MNKTKTILLQSLISLIPIGYYLAIWDKLPDNVPIHYNANFEANGYGSKTEMLFLLLFILGISIISSLILLNIDKFDPKKRYAENSVLIKKITWTSIVFMSLISINIVYITQHYPNVNGLIYLLALVALLFSALGNLMNNAKPSFFFGIRTPWALNDEENWRETHRFGAKLWFWGGLILAILIFVLPKDYTSKLMLFGILPLTIIPYAYSFYLFWKKQKKN